MQSNSGNDSNRPATISTPGKPWKCFLQAAHKPGSGATNKSLKSRLEIDPMETETRVLDCNNCRGLVVLDGSLSTDPEGG